MLDKLFRPRPADGMVLVLGLGRFGIACARRLQELGMDVLGVDADLDLVNRYADTLRHVVRMDSTDADALRQLGLEMEDFGQNTLLMHSYPTWLKGEVTVQVREILDQLLSSRENDGKSLLKLVAAKAAESNVSRRVNLTGAEAADLLLRLQTASDPYRDASGQVAVVRLSQNDLSKLFKKGK